MEAKTVTYINYHNGQPDNTNVKFVVTKTTPYVGPEQEPDVKWKFFIPSDPKYEVSEVDIKAFKDKYCSKE